jgi:hypothetical protein
MDLVTWLFVTSTLVPVGAHAPAVLNGALAPAAPGPALGGSGLSRPDLERGRQQVDQRRRPAAPRPHRLGVGTNITAGNRGAGGSFRYWFGDRVGLDAGVRWYLGQRLPSGDRPSTFQTSPSVLFMLTDPHPDRDVDVRPYVGGGFNYVRATSPYRTTTPSGAGASQRSGVGTQGFGGAEITFKEAERITISVEAGYYKLPAAFANSIYVGGWNYLLLFTYYLR